MHVFKEVDSLQSLRMTILTKTSTKRKEIITKNYTQVQINISILKAFVVSQFFMNTYLF